jgi:hypothetical protein
MPKSTRKPKRIFKNTFKADRPEVMPNFSPDRLRVKITLEWGILYPEDFEENRTACLQKLKRAENLPELKEMLWESLGDLALRKLLKGAKVKIIKQ